MERQHIFHRIIRLGKIQNKFHKHRISNANVLAHIVNIVQSIFLYYIERNKNEISRFCA